jgi:hypothetical protein
MRLYSEVMSSGTPLLIAIADPICSYEFIPKFFILPKIVNLVR